jgi:hypothetical protein
MTWKGANKKYKYFLSDYLGGVKTEKNEDPEFYGTQNRVMGDFALSPVLLAKLRLCQ